MQVQKTQQQVKSARSSQSWLKSSWPYRTHWLLWISSVGCWSWSISKESYLSVEEQEVSVYCSLSLIDSHHQIKVIGENCAEDNAFDNQSSLHWIQSTKSQVHNHLVNNVYTYFLVYILFLLLLVYIFIFKPGMIGKNNHTWPFSPIWFVPGIF